ncbi:MAG: type II toxin-antitoxin system HicB family antitoxin [Nitrospinae bacterium]|nr:type II toxin-antitoxin system HicB family antitoxin [Nitrospinota bacterium]MCG2813108.1 type II toxin-antitoxin system HicB family antitoxin [Thermodesulfovibrionales bacterium]
MLIEYIQTAIEKAEYKRLDDGTWFAEIPGFEGVWVNGNSVEGCRKELMEVLEEWLILKIQDKDPIPIIKGIDINIKEVATV